MVEVGGSGKLSCAQLSVVHPVEKFLICRVFCGALRMVDIE